MRYMKTEKVVVIGGGPAGLAASIYLARAYLNPLVVAGSPSGGQLTLTSDVENYPGFESILGPDLILSFKNHAMKFKTKLLEKNVIKLNVEKTPFSIYTSSGEVIKTESILLATGASAQWLNIPSETRLRGKGVSACATCDGFFFRDKTVAVVGGGDTAMEEALTLTKFANKVYILHRKDSFRASAIMQRRVLENKKITILWNTTIKEVLGEKNVEGLKIIQNGKEKDLKVEGLFLAIGHKPSTDFLSESGVLLDEKGYIKTALQARWEQKNENKFGSEFQYMTNIKGVFAAGDCVDYTYRQAATAVGMGVSAALEIEKYLSEK